MDKNTIATYPGRPAEQDPNRINIDSLDREENRLNTSREILRQRLTQPQSEEKQRTSSDEESSHSINSWSSLLVSMVAPSAKKTAAQHPYTLLIGSALLGAYFAWSRPLRKIVGSVIVGTVVRNLVTASVNAGTQSGGRILRNYLNREPTKKYPPYHKQEHVPAEND